MQYGKRIGFTLPLTKGIRTLPFIENPVLLESISPFGHITAPVPNPSDVTTRN